MASLKEVFPQMWEQEPPCCEEYRLLFLQCAEESGYLAGALDIRIHPNDGKDVWRNYRRVRMRFCPFCGTRLDAEGNSESAK